jgi:hypothetical protein
VYRGRSISVTRGGVGGSITRSFRVPALKAGVKGVKGVLGVEMDLPLHFGQRTEFPADEDDIGNITFDLPPRRG